MGNRVTNHKDIGTFSKYDPKVTHISSKSHSSVPTMAIPLWPPTIAQIISTSLLSRVKNHSVVKRTTNDR